MVFIIVRAEEMTGEERKRNGENFFLKKKINDEIQVSSAFISPQDTCLVTTFQGRNTCTCKLFRGLYDRGKI